VEKAERSWFGTIVLQAVPVLARHVFGYSVDVEFDSFLFWEP